jgi:hypothetical protein
VVTGGASVWVYAALLVGSAGTLPQFRCVTNINAANNNYGLAATDGYRIGTAGSGLTALPASVTLSGMTSHTNYYWAGLS